MSEKENPVNPENLNGTNNTQEAVNVTEAEINLLQEISALTQAKEELEASLKDKEDQHLRAVAELQNFQKRSQDQIAKARDFSIESFAKDLLAVADSLEKSTQTSVDVTDIDAEDLAEHTSKMLMSHAEGTKMTLDVFVESLRKHKIEKIAVAKGDHFNPELHLAMANIEDDKLPANSVLEIFQTGYKIGTRLLRPSMISVSKKPESKPETDK